MSGTPRTKAALDAIFVSGAEADFQDQQDFIASAWTPEWVRYLDHRLPDETPHADDDFFTSDTSGDYTEVTPTGTADWSIARGILAVNATGQSAADIAAFIKPITSASAPMTIETRIPGSSAPGADNAWGGLLFTDGVLASSNMAGQFVYQDTAAPYMRFVHNRVWGGTLTARAASGASATNRTWRGPIYLRVIWKASNTFTYAISNDGVIWTAYSASDTSITITPTHFGFGGTDEGTASAFSPAAFDYFRVYDADLSV